ncbi:hypothetical protein JKP75_04970 [Blastococcus sp. TML/M2B]|uniref:hypothetical protein n=1 Tax=unclassified Blastococcus TaxID=2619396 RepID=UPI00190AA9E7|nr:MULTISPECIES: hypothetical protein [unclassified Blastococcus]MBN1091984.1 hypothetical protein [Blastococcus sp. TML/M2B]MBN1097914.1 hypothetical protein [Blastococcus sp. TML/C7B]
MIRRKLLPPLVAVLALPGLAACGADSSGDVAGGSAQAAEATPAPAQPVTWE